jgi:hypothetical protein
MTLIEQSRKSAASSEENANGSNSSSHRSSYGQKAREKKAALPCQTGSAALADYGTRSIGPLIL